MGVSVWQILVILLVLFLVLAGIWLFIAVLRRQSAGTREANARAERLRRDTRSLRRDDQ